MAGKGGRAETAEEEGMEQTGTYIDTATEEFSDQFIELLHLKKACQHNVF